MLPGDGADEPGRAAGERMAALAGLGGAHSTTRGCSRSPGSCRRRSPRRSLKALRAAVDRLDDWRLIGLHAAATLLGSLVLALAMERRAITAERGVRRGALDELFEIEQWGEDAEQTRRHARLRLDLAAAERFLAPLPPA